MKGELEDLVGPVETADASVRRVASLPFYSSGAGGLDRLLGGGFRAGTLTELFGRSNSGKSQLAMQAALVAAQGGSTVLYVDTEGSFRPERLDQMSAARGWDARTLLGRIVYVRSDSAAGQMETVRRMPERAATRDARMVIVDTLTRNFSVELPGDSNMPSRQAALGIHLSEMARDAYLNGRAYVLTNRVTFGATRDVGIGGKTVEQMVGASVMLGKEGARIRATRVDRGTSVELEVDESGVH